MAKKKHTRVKRKLGTFEVISGKLRISDPCYDKGAWCAGSVSNAAKGTWNAYGSRRKTDDNWEQHRHLIATHQYYNGEEFVKSKIYAGMDAGMAGIFDDKMYKIDYAEDYLQKGNCEYYQSQDVWRAEQDVELYKKMLPVKEGDKFKDISERALLSAEERLKAALQREAEGKFDYSKAEPTRNWYEICCDISQSHYGAGVLRNGCVSSSGYGDGGADVYVAKNADGKVVGVKLVF